MKTIPETAFKIGSDISDAFAIALDVAIATKEVVKLHFNGVLLTV